MSTATNATPAAPSVPADAVCVLVGSGTTRILGYPSFQTYTQDGAKKAATKLEGVHRGNNEKLRAVIAVEESARTDEQKEFLKEYGTEPKPESLEIRFIESMAFGAVQVPRNLPKPVVVLTPEQVKERIAKKQAELAALEAQLSA